MRYILTRKRTASIMNIITSTIITTILFIYYARIKVVQTTLYSSFGRIIIQYRFVNTLATTIKSDANSLHSIYTKCEEYRNASISRLIRLSYLPSIINYKYIQGGSPGILILILSLSIYQIYTSLDFKIILNAYQV